MAHKFVWYPPNEGDAVVFSSAATDYRLLLGYDGCQHMPVIHKTVLSPFQHGARRTNTVGQPRVVTLPIMIIGTSLSDIEGKVQALSTSLNSLDEDGILQREYEDGTIYTLNCIGNGDVIRLGTASSDRTQTFQRAEISFVAHDPFWYSGTMSRLDLAKGGVDFFPFEFPWIIAANVESGYATNSGSFEAPVKITITGPIENPVITNSTTNEAISITLNMADGDTFEIDTGVDDIDPTARYYPTGSSDVNGFPYIDLETTTFWKLKAKTTNAITLAYTSATSPAGIVIEWTDKFVGV